MLARTKRTMALISARNVITRPKVPTEKRTSDGDVFWCAISGNSFEKKYSIGAMARRTANQKRVLSGECDTEIMLLGFFVELGYWT